MKSTKSGTRRKVGKVKPRPGIRRVSLSRLKPVIDPGCRRRATDPDELPPACPACGPAAETLWFIDRRTTRAVLVCIACVPYQPTSDEPEADIPADRAA